MTYLLTYLLRALLTYEERVEDEPEYRGEDGREHDQQQTLDDFGPG